MTQRENIGFSEVSLKIGESVTHGTAMRISQLNAQNTEDNKIIDLSIGTLDVATDKTIDNGVIDFIKNKPDIIHQFAPVKGFDFLRKSIAKRVKRIHGINYDPEHEIMVTPGGIKGSIAVALSTLLNPKDEVILPLPNWPHYSDMVQLHGGKSVFVKSKGLVGDGLNSVDLDNAITDKTKLVILGDCINPTGKVYSTEELTQLSQIIAKHNKKRNQQRKSPIYVLYDCPYEAHILGDRSQALASINIEGYQMRDVVITVTGPGKTYGMHGDRIGYMCGPKHFIEVAANVQVNLNSFAGTYGQIACFYALDEKMDQIAINRATNARKNLLQMIALLRSYNLSVHTPQGGYFIFVDLSSFADSYNKLGYERADQFLLEKARVAAISGEHFAEGYTNAHEYKDCVRMNCGRDISILTKAASRIKDALAGLSK